MDGDDNSGGDGDGSNDNRALRYSQVSAKSGLLEDSCLYKSIQ